MSIRTFSSAFCYQDIRSYILEETKASLEKNLAAAPIQTQALIKSLSAKALCATRLLTRPVSLAIVDVLNSLPVFSQIIGLVHLVKGIQLVHGKDTNGAHALGKGHVVRGVALLLNLGPAVLIADIAVSIFKHYKQNSAENSHPHHKRPLATPHAQPVD